MDVILVVLSSFNHIRRIYFYSKFKYSRTCDLRPITYLEMVVQNNRNYIDYLGLIYTERQRSRFWISPEPISFVALALMLTLTLGINDVIEINVFLSSINTSGNADVSCEHSFYGVFPLPNSYSETYSDANTERLHWDRFQW